MNYELCRLDNGWVGNWKLLKRQFIISTFTFYNMTGLTLRNSKPKQMHDVHFVDTDAYEHRNSEVHMSYVVNIEWRQVIGERGNYIRHKAVAMCIARNEDVVVEERKTLMARNNS